MLYILNWPQIYYVTKDNHDLPILLPLPLSSEIIGTRRHPGFHMVLGDQPQGFGNAK